MRAVGAVDLVDDDDRAQPQRQRLAGDELGLRHRAFGAVDQQDHAVDHRQDALDLAAEIGVAGGVDDVDAGALAALGGRPFDRGALGEDGDPALLLEVVRIHRALFDALVVAEGAGLAEQLVDEGGLAVIDVGDDRHVAEGKRSRHARLSLNSGAAGGARHARTISLLRRNICAGP